MGLGFLFLETNLSMHKRGGRGSVAAFIPRIRGEPPAQHRPATWEVLEGEGGSATQKGV